MSLFRKKKEEKKSSCCCDCNCTPNNIPDAKDIKANGIKILGSGCAKCNTLAKATEDALTDLGINEIVEHVTDFAQIATYGVMSTPALVIDGKVVSYGKVLKKQEIIDLIKKARA